MLWTCRSYVRVCCGVLVLLTGFLSAVGAQPAAAERLPTPLVRRAAAAAAAASRQGPLPRRTRPRGRPARVQRPARRSSKRTAVCPSPRSPTPESRDGPAGPRRRQLRALPALLGPRRTRTRPGRLRLPRRRHRPDTHLAYDAGIRVYPDFHQDLSTPATSSTRAAGTPATEPQVGRGRRTLPTSPAGSASSEDDTTQNAAVKQAQYDFWHNAYGVQDAFLTTAQATMTYVDEHLTTAQFAGLVGFDPFNEPYAGTYDSGQTSRTWERDLLWPFYVKFRARMKRGRLAGQARLRRGQPLLELQHRLPEAGGRPARRGNPRPALCLQHPLLRPEGHLGHPHVGQCRGRPVRHRLRDGPRPRLGRGDDGDRQRVRPSAVGNGLRQGPDRRQGDVPGPRLPPFGSRLVDQTGVLRPGALRKPVAVGHLQRPPSPS